MFGATQWMTFILSFAPSFYLLPCELSMFLHDWLCNKIIKTLPLYFILFPSKNIYIVSLSSSSLEIFISMFDASIWGQWFKRYYPLVWVAKGETPIEMPALSSEEIVYLSSSINIWFAMVWTLVLVILSSFPNQRANLWCCRRLNIG